MIVAALTALLLGSAVPALLPTFAGAAQLHGGGSSPDAELMVSSSLAVPVLVMQGLDAAADIRALG